MKSHRFGRFLPAALFVFLTPALGAQTAAPAGDTAGPDWVGEPVTPVSVDIDLSTLPGVPAWKPGDPVREVPKRWYPNREVPPAIEWKGAPVDALGVKQAEWDAAHGSRMTEALGAPIVNFDGQGNTGVSPSDMAMDVGPNHVIQSINGSGGSLYRIYNKSGTPLTAQLSMETLSAGDANCGLGYGDPIILYDRAAGRWFMLEFTNGSNYLCAYVSKTADPVAGGWWFYKFLANAFPDYPHCAIWTDPTTNAYFCGANESGTGAPIYAYDRANMLTGGVARAQQRFTRPKLSGYGFQIITPVHFTGTTAPPAGTPAYFVRHFDGEAHGSAAADDKLDLFSITLNWTTPASSVITTLPQISITDFNSWFLNYSTFATVPQPGSASLLDPIREVVLNVPVYRNFGTHQSLVGTFSVNQNSATSGSVVDAGARWFELRRIGTGAWTLHQEGTFSPGDTNTHHFLGASHIDGSGNIALAYSYTRTTAPTANPSLRYTGRLSTDSLGVMSQGDNVIVAGAAAETSGRWGDYFQMGLDPSDDCTFWYSGTYRPAGGWTTRIASFKFAECGCLVTPPALSGVAASAPQNNRITVTWPDSSTASITRYYVFRATAAGGPYTQIATVTDTSPGAGNGAGYSYNDNTVSGGITYYYQIQANDGLSCTSPVSNTASATATGACLLPPTFAGATSCTNGALATCTLTVSWVAGAKVCPAASNTLTYDVFRSTTAGFSPAPANRIAIGVSGTSYTDNTVITSGTTYYYVVRAVDSLGNSDANTAQVSSTPTGPGGGTLTYASTDVPKAIPDNAPGGASSTLTVAGNPNTISDVNLTLNVTHTYDGDLAFTLTAPNAAAVALVTNRGGAGDNFTSTVFDDSAATAISAGAAPFTGSFRPESPLTAVNGIPANGTWTLKGVDNAGVDTGSITGWSLAITTASACTAGSARPPEVTSASAGAMLVTKGSTAGTVRLNFADMAGATGYNVYEGALPIVSGTYSHGASGNICNAATTLASGRRSTAATGIGTAGSHYYLVTQYATAEGPSGYNSSAVEIDISKSTCAP